jgi:hypothetical protein
MSAKVPAAVRLAKQALEEGKCVVIGLQSTGEARTEEAVNKYVNLFFSHWKCNEHTKVVIWSMNRKHLVSGLLT